MNPGTNKQDTSIQNKELIYNGTVYRIPQAVAEQLWQDSCIDRVPAYGMREPDDLYRMLAAHGRLDSYIVNTESKSTSRPLEPKDKTLLDHILDWMPLVM